MYPGSLVEPKLKIIESHCDHNIESRCDHTIESRCDHNRKRVSN